MSDPNLTPVKYQENAESYVTWLRNLGANVPPIALWYSGRTNPMEPPHKNFNGRKANGSSRGPERPHQGGSSNSQLSTIIEKLNSPIRKWNTLSIERSVSVTTATATATIPAHLEMICWRSTIGIYVKDTVINRKMLIALVNNAPCAKTNISRFKAMVWIQQ
jgi:hypothetical protein